MDSTKYETPNMCARAHCQLLRRGSRHLARAENVERLLQEDVLKDGAPNLPPGVQNHRLGPRQKRQRQQDAAEN